MNAQVLNLPAHEYHADPALGRSAIHLIHSRGLAVYAEARREPRASTPAMDFGTAVHSILFGNPDKELLIYAGGDRRTKAGKDEWATVQDRALAEHRTPIKEYEYREAMNVARAVLADPDAGPVLAGLSTGLREASIFWDDPDLGCRCKARPDFIPEGGPIIDLKVTGTIPETPEAWAFHAVSMGYDIQDQHYRSAVNAAGLGRRDMWFVVVEREPPYEIAVFCFSHEWNARVLSIRKAVAEALTTAQLEGTFPKRMRGVFDVPVPFRYATEG